MSFGLFETSHSAGSGPIAIDNHYPETSKKFQDRLGEGRIAAGPPMRAENGGFRLPSRKVCMQVKKLKIACVPCPDNRRESDLRPIRQVLQ